MTPGTLWRVVRVDTTEKSRLPVYIEASKWFDARSNASQFFSVSREGVELAVLPDGHEPMLPCRIVRARPNGTLFVSTRRARAPASAPEAAPVEGGNEHE